MTHSAEKHGEFHFLFLESEGPREDSVVLADGANTLDLMNGYMRTRDPHFRSPTIRGITKKMEDGSLIHCVSLAGGAVLRAANSGTLTILAPDGKVVENKGPTEGQIALQLAANNEPLQRALLIFGAKPHDWPNLHNVLEAMEDGNGGESGLIAKHFVADGEIKNFKATANSFPALGPDVRHGTTASGITTPKMTLKEAEEMFRKLFQGWMRELKDRGTP